MKGGINVDESALRGVTVKPMRGASQRRRRGYITGLARWSGSIYERMCPYPAPKS